LEVWGLRSDFILPTISIPAAPITKTGRSGKRGELSISNFVSKYSMDILPD
jgi:hypothetical protein